MSKVEYDEVERSWDLYLRLRSNKIGFNYSTLKIQMRTID